LLSAVDVVRHLACLEVEGTRLGEVGRVAEFDAAIPGCEGWTVRDLLSHVGVVHRWAGRIVREGLARPDGVTAEAPDDDSGLVEWYLDGFSSLVETLRAAPDDVECFAFLPAPSPLAFWARRQALETAIHRADAEAAMGGVAPYEDDLALDGMAELLVGFGARKKVFEPATVRLAPAGAPSWLVTLGPEGLAAEANDPGGAADVTVSGSPSEVYRWMWNRPADVAVEGSAAAAAEWQKLAVRWS